MKKINLRALIPSEFSLEESPIVLDGHELGWSYTFVDRDRMAHGSGTHQSKTIAKMKAVSELTERRLVKKARLTAESAEYGFDLDDSTTGFAVGLTRESTRKRSILEAIERWALSCWIDRGKKINKAVVEEKTLDPLTVFLCQKFENIEFYRKEIQVDFMAESKIFFSAVLGLYKKGVFLGTNASFSENTLWSQACIEMYRNLLIYQRGGRFTVPPGKIVERIDYFGTNGKEGILQVRNAREEWKGCEASITFCRQFDSGVSGLYFYRSLIADTLALSAGSIERFVY